LSVDEFGAKNPREFRSSGVSAGGKTAILLILRFCKSVECLL